MEGFSGMDAGVEGSEGGNNKMACRLCDMRSRKLGEKKGEASEGLKTRGS